MVVEIIFLFSGLLIAILLVAKVWEIRRRKNFFLLAWISRGDESIRTFAHETARHYAEKRERLDFLVSKQLPLKIKSTSAKLNTMVRERGERVFGNIRGSRFLKKSDGISEFFKNMSEMEGEGRIDETFDNPEEHNQ